MNLTDYPIKEHPDLLADEKEIHITILNKLNENGINIMIIFAEKRTAINWAINMVRAGKAELIDFLIVKKRGTKYLCGIKIQTTIDYLTLKSKSRTQKNLSSVFNRPN